MWTVQEPELALLERSDVLDQLRTYGAEHLQLLVGFCGP